MRLVFDLEADGLKFEATVIWCLVAYDLDDKKWYKFGHEEGCARYKEEIRQLLLSADELICHNLLNYDLSVLSKLGYVDYEDLANKATDTLIMSQLFRHDRPKPEGCKSGPHGLEAWGIRNNIPKPVHEDWSQYSKEMMKRCVDDVKNNVVTYRKLCNERDVKYGKWDWTLTLKIEHKIAQLQNEQEWNGWEFDKEWAERCIEDLTEKCDSLYQKIRPHLRQEIKIHETKAHGEINYVRKPFLKSGELNKRVEDYCASSGIDTCCISGPFTRLSYQEPDLNKTAKLKEQMLRLGWEPDEYNTNDEGMRTSPKITESSLETLEGELGSWIRHWTVYRHRKSQIQGWLDRLRPDGRITAEANPLGAVTGRYTHKTVVNVPKASPGVIYGTEMRSCFIARPGYKLCGVDADGLELRMLAHYMNDEPYIEAVVNGDKTKGTDAHSVNMRAAGLPNRDNAKTFFYGFIYGAGDPKIGKIIDGTSEDGRCLRVSFLQQLPALDRLIKEVQASAKDGYITGLDGRRLVLRQKHKALNTLLQGGGALVMKVALMFLMKWCKKEKLDVRLVGNIHDEFQCEVAEKDVDRYKLLAVHSIKQAGKFLQLRCPLDGEAQAGDNWAQTH